MCEEYRYSLEKLNINKIVQVSFYCLIRIAGEKYQKVYNALQMQNKKYISYNWSKKMKYWANVDEAPHKVFLGLGVFMFVQITQRPLRKEDIDICKKAKYIEVILIFFPRKYKTNSNNVWHQVSLVKENSSVFK